MDPVLIAYLAKFGIDAVTGIIRAWQDSGSPTPDAIRAAFITRPPEDYFREQPAKEEGAT
jgi:hypothetical protein